MTVRIGWEDGWPVIGCDEQPSEVAPVPGDGTHCGDTGGNDDGTLSAGTYRISNQNSGLLLEVGDADASEGATVNQWSDTGHPCQEWELIEHGDGTHRLENGHRTHAVGGGRFDERGCYAGPARLRDHRRSALAYPRGRRRLVSPRERRQRLRRGRAGGVDRRRRRRHPVELAER